MMEVCQKCGDKGDKKRLVHCVKCRVAAEHSYCFDTLPTNGHKKNIIWTCDECVPRDVKPVLEPSIRSARISQAAEIKLNRIQMLRQMSFSTTVHSQPSSTDADQLTKKMQSTRDSSFQTEEIERPQKRRLVIEDDGSDEESQSVEFTAGDPPQLGHIINAYPLNMSSLDTKTYVHAHPVIDPIWSGCLGIENNNNATTIGVVAHLSTKSCLKVKDAIKELPMLLNAEILPRSDICPWKFQNAHPTDECIAVYLFPEHERDEKRFDGLMNGMIIHDQALKVVMKTVQLFVFSSRELPAENWRSITYGVCLNRHDKSPSQLESKCV